MIGQDNILPMVVFDEKCKVVEKCNEAHNLVKAEILRRFAELEQKASAAEEASLEKSQIILQLGQKTLRLDTVART